MIPTVFGIPKLIAVAKGGQEQGRASLSSYQARVGLFDHHGCWNRTLLETEAREGFACLESCADPQGNLVPDTPVVSQHYAYNSANSRASQGGHSAQTCTHYDQCRRMQKIMCLFKSWMRCLQLQLECPAPCHSSLNLCSCHVSSRCSFQPMRWNTDHDQERRHSSYVHASHTMLSRELVTSALLGPVNDSVAMSWS